MDLSLKPSEGLGVLHLFCKYQSSVDSEKVKKTVSETLDKGLQVVVAVMLGHKADLALMVLGEDLWDLRDFQSSVDSRFGSSKVIHDIIQKLHDQGLYIYSVDAYRMDSGDFYREYSFTRTAEEIKKN